MCGCTCQRECDFSTLRARRLPLLQAAEIALEWPLGNVLRMCQSPPIHARVCTWHAILQMEVRTVCCRQPRRLYASRYCELKRFVGSSGGCSRAAEGRFLKQCEITVCLFKHTRGHTKHPRGHTKHPRGHTKHRVARHASHTDARTHRSRVVAAARSSQNDARRFRRGESAAGPPYSDGNRAAPKGHGS